MESDASSPAEPPECEICLNVFGPWRRAKLLECKHTCCSLCLVRMASERHAHDGATAANQSAAAAATAETSRDEPGADRGEPGRGRAIRCPWCRQVTPVPAGLSVLHLPDDPDKMAASAAAAPPRTPVLVSMFVRLAPGHASYQPPPPPGDVDRAGVGRGVRVVPKGRWTRGGSGDRGGPGGGHGLGGRGLAGAGRILEEGERGVLGLGEGQTEDEELRRRTLWTRACAVIVIGLGLFLLLCVIAHIVTCNSARFSIIACG